MFQYSMNGFTEITTW